MNSGGGEKSGKKMRRGINRSSSMDDNEVDMHIFYMGGEEGAEWKIMKGTRTRTRRARRRKKNNGGCGGRCCRQCKRRQSEEGGEPIPVHQTYQEVKHSDRIDREGDVIRKNLVDEGRGG